VFFFSGVVANSQLDPVDTSSLTKPLIVDPNAPTEAQQESLASIAKIFADEPASASVETPSASEEDSLVNLLSAGSASGTGGGAAAGGGGSDSSNGDQSSTDSSSTDSSDSTSSDSSQAADPSAIEKEIRLLNSLVEHGKAIAAALPAKEQRLQELAAELNSANGKQAAAGASAKLAEQQLLLKEIQLKVVALKQKLEDLETTQTKLQTSIDKVQQAVNTNEAVNHQLDQEVAKASVGGDTTTAAGGDTAGAAPAAVAPAPALIDYHEADRVSQEARAVLGALKRGKHHRS